MPTQLVTIEYVNQPKPGKKFGSIKTKELGYIGALPNLLAKCVVGQQTVEWEQNGEYKNLASVHDDGPKPSEQAPQKRTSSAEMFVMAVMGKAYQGTGTIPATEILEEHLRSLLAAWKNVMENNDTPF